MNRYLTFLATLAFVCLQHVGAYSQCSATITTAGPNPTCGGSGLTLTASGGDTYLWSNGATVREIMNVVPKK